MKKIFLKVLVLAVALSVITAVSTFTISGAETVSTKDLAAYWKFDEGSGTTVADQSGNGRDLTVKGNSNWVQGKQGKAFDLDGKTTLSMDGKKQISAYNFTVSVFLNIKDFPASDTGANIFLVNEGVSALGQGAVDFGFFDKKPYSYVTGIKWDQGDRVVADVDFSKMTGSWHHLAVVYNQDHSEELGKAFLYVDGKQKGEADLTMTSGGNIFLGFPKTASYPKYNASIGGYRNDSGEVGRAIAGAIDEMMIFNRALTGDEIAQLAGGKSESTDSKATPKPTTSGSGESSANEGTAAESTANGSTDSTAGTDSTAAAESSTASEATPAASESSQESTGTVQEASAGTDQQASTVVAETEGTAEEDTATVQQGETGENTQDTNKTSGSSVLLWVAIVAALAAVGAAIYVVVRRGKQK